MFVVQNVIPIFSNMLNNGHARLAYWLRMEFPYGIECKAFEKKVLIIEW